MNVRENRRNKKLKTQIFFFAEKWKKIWGTELGANIFSWNQTQEIFIKELICLKHRRGYRNSKKLDAREFSRINTKEDGKKEEIKDNYLLVRKNKNSK